MLRRNGDAHSSAIHTLKEYPAREGVKRGRRRHGLLQPATSTRAQRGRRQRGALKSNDCDRAVPAGDTQAGEVGRRVRVEWFEGRSVTPPARAARCDLALHAPVALKTCKGIALDSLAPSSSAPPAAP